MSDLNADLPSQADPAALRRYYAARAREYEAIYRKPERQNDLRAIADVLPECFTGRRVLEVAAGTGFWTQVIAASARSVVATDINPETLAVARTKRFPDGRVILTEADAYALDAVAGDFDAGFAGFWWSHLTQADLRRFLDGFHARLGPGARVVILDNRFVEGSSTPIAHRDAEGSSYQDRHLRDGSVHRVLKNFPSATDVARSLGGSADHLTVHEFPYYWMAVYTVAPDPARAEPS